MNPRHKKHEETTEKHIIINLPKIRDEEKILKVARENTHRIQKGKRQLISVENNANQRKWAASLEYWKEENKLEFYAPWKCISKNESDTTFFRPIKSRRVHCQQTHTVRNVKGNLLGRKKIIPHENMDLYNGIWKVLGMWTIWVNMQVILLLFKKH